MDIIRLYVVSFHGDLSKERETLYKEVLPDLRAWCENKQIQLLETDVRWGDCMPKEHLNAIKKEIQEAYFNGEMPMFINLSCDSLGLVPMWQDTQEAVLEDIHRALHVSEDEMEILYGAYREDNPNSVFLVRDDSFLDDLGPIERQHFVKKRLLSGQQCQICGKCLEKYPEERVLRHSYDSVYYDISTKQMNIDMTESSFTQVLKFLQAQIEREHPSVNTTVNVYEQMRTSHETFMKACSVKVKGRESVIQQLEEHIQTGGKDVPLLILGGTGSGKSSVMSKAAQQFSQQAYLDKYLPSESQDTWLVFYHFVGGVPGSTDLLTMLKRLLLELAIITESTMPHDVDSAAQMCCSALSSGTNRPVVVIVDAVNQFNDESASQIMSWVPRKLAPNVRCIVSMINDTIQHKKLMARESKPEELRLVPLDFEARKQIVTEMLFKYSHSLSKDQMNCLMTKSASENPLWLTVACEELRLIQDQKMLDNRIRDMPDNLLDLLEEVLQRLEANKGSLLVATLCLLEVSVAGLLESELRMLLGNRQEPVVSSPYEEKDETESSEKDLGKKKRSQEPLSEQKWLDIFRDLRPYLRPYGDSREGRLDFYHRALSKAVRSKYFKVQGENESCEESQDAYRHWHQQLADYFENCDNLDRKAEEYLCHLCHIEDSYRLSQCLCDWSMLDKLYHEEYSSELLVYWRKAGGTEEMIRCYGEALAELEAVVPKDDKLIALCYELVARIYLQAGRYTEALELARTVIKWEEKELGNRPERMVDLNSLMAEIYEEKLKLNDFVSPTQLPDLRKTIMFARKSIELRKAFDGIYHKLKLAVSLMKLAFSLESWNACGGAEREMTGEEAIKEGNEHIDKAITIFQELKDAGHYAEALMTKGVLAPRGSMEQLKFYNEAMDICRQVYGEESLLSSRLYINIGIVYEDNNDYVKAYEYFKKWAEVSEIVLGPEHPKTIRAKGVLREPRYVLVSLRITQQYDSNNAAMENDNNVIDEASINREVDTLDDEDTFSSEEDHEEEEDDIDSEHGPQQSVIEASDFMQRVLNEIWERMSEDNRQPSSPEHSTSHVPAAEGVSLPASHSLLIRSNPLRQYLDGGIHPPASSGSREDGGVIPITDNRLIEEIETRLSGEGASPELSGENRDRESSDDNVADPNDVFSDLDSHLRLFSRFDNEDNG